MDAQSTTIVNSISGLVLYMVLNYRGNFQNLRIHKCFTQHNQIYVKTPAYLRLTVQISIWRFLKESYFPYLLIA